MDKKEKISSIKKKLVEYRKELEQLKDDISSQEMQKIKSSISSSISFLNRASKQIDNLTKLEGQMNLFDYMDNDGNFDLSDSEEENFDIIS